MRALETKRSRYLDGGKLIQPYHPCTLASSTLTIPAIG